jgi:hypothetical protein
MKRITGTLLVIVAAILVWAQPGRAADLREVLSGKSFPLTMQLKDLNDQWWHVKVGSAADAGNIAQVYATMFGSGGGAYFTQGTTVNLSGETFLIGYKTKQKPFNMAQLMRASEPPAAEKLTPETQLALSLLNLKAVSSLDDMRPFNLDQEIAESQAAAVSIFEEEGGSASESNLKQITLAMHMYATDHDEMLPPMKDPAQVKALLMPYCKNEELFVDPRTKQPYQVNTVLSDHKLAHITKPDEMVVFYEAAPDDDGMRAVAFLDGRVKRIAEAEWPTVARASKIPVTP